MPKFPDFAERTTQITGSVFEKFRSQMEKQGSHLVGLHIGDSYAAPPYRLPLDERFLASHPGFNRYTDTFGVPALRDALAEKLRLENRLDVDRGRVMMTSGACNALAIATQGIVNAGDDVLILAPYWPFFRGMVRLAGGNAVEVPFYTRLYEDPGLDIQSYLETVLTPRTIAIYTNTPNNPSGKVLSGDHLQQIASFAADNNLWVISDEAYDGMTFDGHRHLSIGALPGMFERTLSVFTFSKVYMFSGLRLGYVAAAENVLKMLNKIMVHQLYSPSTVGQQMMVEPVKTRGEWSERFVKHFGDIRDMFVKNLSISPQIPEGTYYFFFPITDYLHGRDYWDVIHQCMDQGVAVAPGQDFGKHYADWVRVCFTGEPPDRVELAVDRLNKILPG